MRALRTINRQSLNAPEESLDALNGDLRRGPQRRRPTWKKGAPSEYGGNMEAV
jgi:hypothetical protein